MLVLPEPSRSSDVDDRPGSSLQPILSSQLALNLSQVQFLDKRSFRWYTATHRHHRVPLSPSVSVRAKSALNIAGLNELTDPSGNMLRGPVCRP